jgi:hypothetical protein
MTSSSNSHQPYDPGLVVSSYRPDLPLPNPYRDSLIDSEERAADRSS